MRFPRRKASTARTPADDQAGWSGPPPLSGRACCCPARPVVRVLIPPGSARPHSAGLLLCGHHYVASRTALAAVRAVVIDETGTVLEPAPAVIETSGAAHIDPAPRR